MTLFVKQSTAVTLVVGPFLDSTDGVTAETALTITQADVQLSKNAGAFAQKNNATAATHMTLGHYSVPLSTTDTNTLGHLRLAISEAGAMPVWQDLLVLPANVYDSLVGNTDALDVSVIQWLGAAPNALVSSRVDASVGAIAAALDTFDAKIWLIDDDSGVNDRWVVAWYQNGQAIISGITSPTLRVFRVSDGANLFTAAAMTQIGSEGVYRLNQTSTRVVDGTAYVAVAQATIGGSTRTAIQPVGRDN